MRFSRIAMSAALVGGLVAGADPVALAACETVYVPAFDVRLDPRRDTYRLGETALVDVTVTRTDTGTPVADAPTIVYIRPNRDGFVFGGAYTDDSGEAVVRLKLKKKVVRPGPATIHARSEKGTSDPTSCAEVVEFGEARRPNAFVVKR